MENSNSELQHSRANMASYGFAKFLGEFIENAFASWAFFFYEVTIGLDSLLVGLGYIIFALWNAFNDPLMGFLTNRPFKFTRKWGRRFPWIYIGGIPYVLSYVLIFTPPAVDPTSGAFLIFLYLIFATCLFDTFNSIFFINFVSLFPDKFRSSKERRTATGIQTPIGIFGVAFGFIIPPLIISGENPFTFVLQAIVMAVIGLIVLSIAIPGCREDQITIDRYLETEKKEERTPFLKSLVQALKHGSFVAFIVGYMLYRCLIVSMQASVPYVVDFVLLKDDDYVTILSAGFLIGALVSSPFWAWFAQRTNNNKKALLISSSLLVIFTFPLTFINNWILMLFGLLLWGIGLGGYWTMISPVLADIIDESVVQSGKREEGIYNGFLQFFGRLGILFQALSFTIIHIFTGFIEGASAGAQPESAIFGVQMHFALIPAIVMLVGTLIFWKYYKLTPDKVEEHQAQVRELKL